MSYENPRSRREVQVGIRSCWTQITPEVLGMHEVTQDENTEREKCEYRHIPRGTFRKLRYRKRLRSSLFIEE